MYAVVMAGGMGTRLWPKSRAARPKQFHSLLGESTPLADTLSRLKGLAPAEKTIIAAGSAHRHLVEQALAPGMRGIYEPCARGTASCLGLAAWHILREEPGETVVALSADNWVEPGSEFSRAVTAAAARAARGGLTVIGTKPSEPATGFGYIKPEPLTQNEPAVYRMVDFIEKPPLETAKTLLAEGWLWNTGLLAFRPEELLEEIGRLQPALAEGLAEIGRAYGRASFDDVLSRTWRNLPVVSVDDGILARGPAGAWVVRADFVWADLGTWDAVRRLALADAGENGNAATGETALWQSWNCLVRAEGGRFVAVVGAENLTIVDTPDALLILGPDHSQNVRQITAYLKEHGREDLL